jgi:hypothetical protein
MTTLYLIRNTLSLLNGGRIVSARNTNGLYSVVNVAMMVAGDIDPVPDGWFGIWLMPDLYQNPDEFVKRFEPTATLEAKPIKRWGSILFEGIKTPLNPYRFIFKNESGCTLPVDCQWRIFK